MLRADITFPAYVGVAPGTTTFTYDGVNGLGNIPPHPTQAWEIPQDAYSEAVKMAVPPNQFLPKVGYALPHDPLQAWVEWPMENDRVRMMVPENQIKAGAVTGNPRVRASVPEIQRTFGPFPNDLMAVPTVNYLPYRKGWIHHDQGDIFTLQGAPLGSMAATPASAQKWAIVASVVSAIALATTTAIAVMEFRSRGRR